MAPKQKKQNLKAELHAVFGNLNGELIHLVDAAVRGQFSSQEFITRLTNTRTFRRTFPGLLEPNGTIANALSHGEGVSVSVSSLGQAVKQYRASLASYEQVAQRYGTNFNKQMMAVALKGQVSPNEYADRLGAIDYVQKNPGVKDALMQIYGTKSIQDVYRFAAGGAEQTFYDKYEAARLQAEGTGLTGQAAVDAAKGLPYKPGQPVDIGGIIASVRDNLAQAAGPLEQAGISRSDLLKFAADPSADPDLAGKINQVLQAQKSLAGSYVPGMQNRQGSGGGLAQFDQEQQASYG